VEQNNSTQQVNSNIEPVKERVLSVDVLRGFDMFWIVGGSGFFLALFRLLGGPFDKYLSPHMDHAAWDGFFFYDLIFPLFAFIMGMSIVFSIPKVIKTQGKKAAYKKIIKRSIILFVFGVIYYGGLSGGIENIRLLGVLQRLAITYLITSIFFIHFKLRGLIIAFLVILISYWALLSFVPVPGTGKASFSEEMNWPKWVDIHYLPLLKWDAHLDKNGQLIDWERKWDHEGILSTVPAIDSCIFGVFAALILINEKVNQKKKVLYFIGGGIVLVLLGYLWGIQFPINKKIWTSSYVLLAGGYSFILMGVFYQVIDIWKIQKWAIPFIWIGMNPIAIYMIQNIFSFDNLAYRIVGRKELCFLGEDVGLLCGTFLALVLMLAFARFLYKKKIFLKL
jgi:predicted acyltransferase